MDLNRLGRGQFGNAFARIFGVDDLDGVGSLAPEIMPTSSLWERPEFWALIGGNLCQVGATLLGGAGFNATVQIENPANSGVLAIAELISSGAPQPMEIGVELTSNLTVLAQGLGASHRDSRRFGEGALGPARGVACVVRSSVLLVTQGSLNPYRFTGPGQSQYFAVWGPGRSLQLRNPNATQTLDFGICWRERPYGPNELSL